MTKNRNGPWTTTEIATLRENASLGVAELARQLDRSQASVRRCAERQRVSLRRPGHRRGLVLGQPRGVSLAPALRRDLVDGTVDAQLLAERMRIDAEAAICPTCGHRPVRVVATGSCRTCHVRKLTEAHLERIDELDAQRALLTSRKALERARKHVYAPDEAGPIVGGSPGRALRPAAHAGIPLTP